jgi:hypothetical protein
MARSLPRLTVDGLSPPGVALRALTLTVAGLVLTLAAAACRFDRSGVAPNADGAAVEVPDLSCFGPDLGAQLPGVLLARSVGNNPPQVDGLLEDWSCVAFEALDASAAGYVDSTYSGAVPVSGEFAVRWSEEQLYLAIQVRDPDVGGVATDPYEIFDNDSVAIYLDGDATLTGDYTDEDHHFVVDHARRISDYPHDPPEPQLFKAAVERSAAGFAVEVQISYEAVGTALFADGRRLGFDLAISDGDGLDRHALLVWYMRPKSDYLSCACADCCCKAIEDDDMPDCDTWRFGELVLRRD